VAETKLKYAAAAALTITLNSLANNAARQATLFDNSSTLYDDVLLGGGFKTAAGSLGTNPVVSVYVAALTDGTNYGGTNGANVLGGGDAAFTMPTNLGNLRLAQAVPINTAAAAEYMQPISVAALFGGTLPPKFVIVAVNSTGLALDGSAGGTVYATGVTTTTA
jgi:hypothetical protein